MKPVLICTGHTGGHFFPAMGFQETFRSEHPEAEVHIVLTRLPDFAKSVAHGDGFHLHVIPCSAPPPFFSFKMIPFLLEYARAFWKTLSLVLTLKPALVVGFGSFSSVPGVFCAAVLKIPILLHEQNAGLGRANQFLSLWADRIAVSFPDQEARCSKRKVFWSGLPLRRNFREGVARVSARTVAEKTFTVLVFGGSQGAKRLNQVFLEALEGLESEERVDLAVIHIIGNDDLEPIQAAYRKLGIRAEVSKFIDRILECYQRADLVIARAGAGTIFELAAVGRAAILIPYPHAYQHQKTNGQYLARCGAACVIDEQELSRGLLKDRINEFRQDIRHRLQLEERIRLLAKPEANHILTEAAWTLMCERG